MLIKQLIRIVLGVLFWNMYLIVKVMKQSNEKKKKINIQYDLQNLSEIFLLLYFFYNVGGFYNNINFYLYLSNDYFQGIEMFY